MQVTTTPLQTAPEGKVNTRQLLLQATSMFVATLTLTLPVVQMQEFVRRLNFRVDSDSPGRICGRI